ncbi:MAG: tyrosine-type recombinase/integrase [Parasphingorhabdus sp.]
MAAQRPKLGKYLEWNNGTIRVTLAVPRKLQDIVGKTKMKRSLFTDSPASAERIKHGVIQELKDEMSREVQKSTKGPPTVVQEALDWRESVVEAEGGQGENVKSFLITERARELEKSDGYVAAREFSDIATGRVTPVDQMLETYLSESELKERSKDTARYSVRIYCEWCDENEVPQTIEAATRRTVGKFVSDRLLANMQRKTAQKYISFLSSYWKWMEAKGYTEEIPWSRQLQGVGKAKPKSNLLLSSGEPNSGKRAYTDEEVRKILYATVTNKTDRRSIDLCWLAALSGMRLDEICRLTVADCSDGWFSVNSKPGEGKSDAASRRVPIHSQLTDILERRSKNKVPDDYLIEDLPLPANGRERSMPASKAYTRFRRRLGVDEVFPGQRHSNVDFHSWRRWFIQHARDAQNSLYVISDLVGHDTSSLPGGLTMNTYGGTSSEEDMWNCVESVQFPKQ